MIKSDFMLEEANLILLGPSGVGKGTQAEMLIEKYKLKHISTGDLFNRAVRAQTPLGREIESYTSQGKLVPDDVVIKIILEDIKGHKNGFLFDGFPRTASQARSLLQNLEIHVVIYLDGDEETVLNRLSNRLFCDCGHSHGPSNPPATEGICDECGGTLYRRSDDEIEIARVRFREYRENTHPLLRFFRDKLIPVDATQSIDQVFEDICVKLHKKIRAH